MNNLENRKTNFDVKHLALSGILVAIGFVLHSVVPPIFFGVKPDFLLACMFVAISASKNSKNLIALCVVCAIIGALTTAFPGGQIPNIIDKLVSGAFVYFALKFVKDEMSTTAKTLSFGAIVFLGTVVSGLIFLASALAIAGLPAPLSSLFVVVVLPTAVANIFVGLIMFLILQKIKSTK